MRIVAEDSTVKFSFNTTQFSTGAPFLLAGTPTMHARVDGGATEVTLGFTLAANYDSKVGENNVVLDLSASASYTAGSVVEVFIAAGTVDSVSVVALKVYEILIGTDGSLDAAITRLLLALPAAADDAAGGLPISDAGGLDLDAKLANTNEVTAARMGALTDWIDGGRLDVLLDAIPTTTMRGTDSAATEAKQDVIDGIVDTILVNTSGLLIASGSVGAGSTALIVNCVGITHSDGELDDHLLVIFDTTASEYHSRWIEAWEGAGDDLATVLTAFPFTPTTGDTYYIMAIIPPVKATEEVTLNNGTIGATGNDTTHLKLKTPLYLDDDFNDHLIVIKDISTSTYHTRWIEDFVASTDIVTLDAALPFTPQASTDLYWVRATRRDVTGGGGTITDITAAALAKFSSVDSGETSPVAGSVAKLAQAVSGSTVNVQTESVNITSEND